MKQTSGLLLAGSLKKAGVIFYQRNGQTIIRVAHSNERRSNTAAQFVQRQRMRHTTALWQMLKPLAPMFSGGKSVYARFATLANRLPAVFVPCQGPLSGASFLMPDLPVSDGSLPPVKQWLDSAALRTTLRAGDLHRNEKLLLYTAEQRIEQHTPRVRFLPVREVGLDEFTEVEGRLALTGEVFADDNKGWALVRVEGDRCSTQCLVTRCRLYEQYTTEEAMKKAAESYGGITE